MSGRHPPRDLLADLAAEILTQDEARLVEAHVIGCARCADLLADAERMRQLLREGDPGPMPTQVWDRIASSLRVETATWSPGASSTPPAESGHLGPGLFTDSPSDMVFNPPPTPSPTPQPSPPLEPVTDPWLTQEWPTAVDAGSAPDPPQAAENVQEAPTGQWAHFLHEPQADPDPEPPAALSAELDDDGASPETSTARPAPVIAQRRGSTATLRSRRQIRSEDRTMSLVRYARPLAIAAGVLGLAAIAGLTAVRLPLGGQDTATTTAEAGSQSPSAAGADRAAAAAPPGAASPGAADSNVGTVTLTTGMNYTRATLAHQAQALTPASRQNAASSASSGAQTMGAMASVAGNATLTDPAKLAECLAALNVDNAQPIAIDFARFEGEDAAIILLAARDGGYEVWAVSRTCGPDDSGGREFVTIPAS